jgi:hypothetical protein
MRSWSLLIAGAAISICVDVHAQAPELRDLLRQAPIIPSDGKLPGVFNHKELPPTPGFEGNAESKPQAESKAQPEPHIPATPQSKPVEVPTKSDRLPGDFLLNGGAGKKTDIKIPAALQKQLDDALAGKDYMLLAKAILAAPPIERFVWLTKSLYSGKPGFLVYPLL